MRLFLKNIFLFAVLILVLFGICISIKYGVTMSLDFKESKDIHFLFVGASHPYHGVDQNLFKTGINKSAESERYMFTYLKLKKILEANSQIDTVFLQCAPTDLWENTDDKYFNQNEMSKFVPLYFPLFSEEEWKIYSRHLKDIVPLIIQKSFSREQLDPNRILKNFGSQRPKQENLLSIDTSTVFPNRVTGYSGHQINYNYLRKIIDLCNEKNVKLYGVYYPVYHPEYYYDQPYYYKALTDSFSDLEVLDYHAMAIPDSARYDAHHLNWYGSQVFTNELKYRFKIK